MIKATELRIGNWVETDGESYRICGKDFVYLELSEDEFEPVTLTSGILEKAGFVKCKNGFQLTILDGYVFIGSLFSGFPLTIEIDGNRMPMHHVKYVHQLQNLYFALTGEELNIEL